VCSIPTAASVTGNTPPDLLLGGCRWLKGDSAATITGALIYPIILCVRAPGVTLKAKATSHVRPK
jgi:hypothetical protein